MYKPVTSLLHWDTNRHDRALASHFGEPKRKGGCHGHVLQVCTVRACDDRVNQMLHDVLPGHRCTAV